MWIAKGVLLGLLLFVGGGFLYLLIRIGVGFYQAAQAAKAGVSQPLTATDIRVIPLTILQSPIFWLALLTAIGIGLWIVRARTHSV